MLFKLVIIFLFILIFFYLRNFLKFDKESSENKKEVIPFDSGIKLEQWLNNNLLSN